MVIILFVVLLAVVALKQRPRKVTFRVESRTALRCGCVLVREEVTGQNALAPCAAHRLMADAL